ncbi:MAG: ABC transporter permease [Candidatus Hydrogenedentes bacterium]|nr:ABC transporter permease [Candidatus Hydrogenedentota bacterium]
MSLWHIAWGYLWNRKLTTILTILSVALAVGLIAAVLTLREETRKRFEEEGQAFDLVVGAPGSPLQLVLSSVYFMDNPTGNIDIKLLDQISSETEYVEKAFPVNLGDSYAGFRIAGVTRELFDHKWVNTYGVERAPFALAAGRYPEQPMEVVLGAAVARQTGLPLEETFISTHGMIDMGDLNVINHSDMPYKVVGILKPSDSPFDRAIYTPLESVWHAHEGHSESATGDEVDPKTMITSILLQLSSPGYRYQFQEILSQKYRVMSAIPVKVISDLYDKLLNTAKTILLAIGYLVVVVSSLSILIGLYLSILQRRRDLAIMRALGASSWEIFGAVLIEAFLVTVLGIVAGWFLGNVVTFALGQVLAQRFGLIITTFGIVPDEITAFATVALVGILAGILPAWQAYDSDVARDLAER